MTILFVKINQKWFVQKDLPAFSLIESPAAYLKALESGDIDVLKNISKVDDVKNQSHSLFKLFANETNENYLSIVNKVAKVSDKNEVKFEEQNLVTNILISEEFSNFLES